MSWVHDLGRSTATDSALLPHAVLGEELADDAGLDDKLASVVGPTSLGKLYSENPAVRAKPSKLVLPCALYMDGVSFLKQEKLWASGL